MILKDPTGFGWAGEKTLRQVVKGGKDIALGIFDAVASDVTGQDVRTGDQNSTLYKSAKLTTHIVDAYAGTELAITGTGAEYVGIVLIPETGGASLSISAAGVGLTAGGLWFGGNALSNGSQMLSEMSQNGGNVPNERKLWQPTFENSEKVAEHGRFGKFYKHSDGTWWSKDLDGHGKSAWKVFKEKNGKLEWFKDADEYGNYIEGKHKSDVGRIINMKELKILK